ALNVAPGHVDVGGQIHGVPLAEGVRRRRARTHHHRPGHRDRTQSGLSRIRHRVLPPSRHIYAPTAQVVRRYGRAVNLEELQWFVVLAETEHVTDDAAELGLSQPTLSRALNRFEHQVGAPLFDRVSRRLRLNAYGQIMLEHA